MKISLKDLTLGFLLNKQLEESGNTKEIKATQRKIKLIKEEESE